MGRLPTFLCLFALATAACAGEPDAEPGAAPDAVAAGSPPGFQALSLFGDSLYEQADTTGQVAEADAALAAAPDDVELIIAAARVRRNFWQYRQEVELYTRALERAPDDWRPYRFRGHRYISLRDFGGAVADLERARGLAPLNWDVSYHLGLAYYVSGRFGDAADEYLRCLSLGSDAAARAAQTDDFRSCSQNADDPESRVAMTEWAARALLRAGRAEEAAALVGEVPSDLAVTENIAYHHGLLYQKGEIEAASLLEPGPDGPYRLETVGYSVASRMLAAGDTAAARPVLERLVADPWWPGFGRIAAEADLARLRGM